MIDLKLCGNHSFKDLQLAISSRAKYIGVIFAESKRQVSPLDCRRWLKQLEKAEDQYIVGVFVNPTLEELQTTLQYVPLDIIQYHGTETVEEIEQFKLKTNKVAWKAIHHDENGLDQMKKYRGIVDGYVIDSKVKGAWGGTGQSFNWEITPTYRQEAEVQEVPCFIAGGITPENVDRLLAYRPLGIDISSGIETNGEKDQRKIEILIERLNRK